MDNEYAISAISSFVLSLVPFFLLVAAVFFGASATPLFLVFYLVTPLLAVGFGIFALLAIRLHHLQGTSLAAFGTLLGILYVILFEIFFLA